MLITRRSLLAGLGLAVTAPVIVRAASLMPVRALPQDWWWGDVNPELLLSGRDYATLAQWNEYVEGTYVDILRGAVLASKGVNPSWTQFWIDDDYVERIFDRGESA